MWKESVRMFFFNSRYTPYPKDNYTPKFFHMSITQRHFPRLC